MSLVHTGGCWTENQVTVLGQTMLIMVCLELVVLQKRLSLLTIDFTSDVLTFLLELYQICLMQCEQPLRESGLAGCAASVL